MTTQAVVIAILFLNEQDPKDINGLSWTLATLTITS